MQKQKNETGGRDRFDEDEKQEKKPVVRPHRRIKKQDAHKRHVVGREGTPESLRGSRNRQEPRQKLGADVEKSDAAVRLKIEKERSEDVQGRESIKSRAFFLYGGRRARA